METRVYRHRTAGYVASSGGLHGHGRQQHRYRLLLKAYKSSNLLT